MRTQSELDQEFLSRLQTMILFARPSFIRLLLIMGLGTFLGIYESSVSDNWLSVAVRFSSTILFVIGIVEASRFGFLFASKLSGILSTLVVIFSFFVSYCTYRLFEFLELTPLHETAGWSLGLSLGIAIGVLMFHTQENH